MKVTQTAYQSSTLNEYGYVYKTELALDQNDETFSSTVGSLSEAAWFTLELGKPYLSGRLHVNMRVINIIGESIGKQQAYILLMNDFDAHSNPPNASIHHVCWKTKDLESFNSFITSKSCFTETNDSFQYVAVLVPVGFKINLHSIQFIEEDRNVALFKRTKSVYFLDTESDLAVDNDKDTCSFWDLEWLLVDLGRPYLIGRVIFEIDLRRGISNSGVLSVLTMNNFDQLYNIPNSSVHNVCWENTIVQDHIKISYKNSVSCITTVPYRYVGLFYNQSDMSVCDLQVYEAEQNGTKTAYQSSTLNEYGYVYRTELALDQNDETFSATVGSLSEAAWFTLNLGKPHLSGRLHVNLRVIGFNNEREKEYRFDLKSGNMEVIGESVNMQHAYVVMMNDFDAHLNPPNASIHHVCWKTGILMSLNSFIKSKSCFTKTNVPFQYVAVLVPAGFQLKVHSIQFIEGRNIALFKTAEYSENHLSAEEAVDDDKDTCTLIRSLKWLLVDLGRPYLIGRVNYEITLKQNRSNSGLLSVLTMNNYDRRLNYPNPSIHNVCWETIVIPEPRKIKYEHNVSCITTVPYRYVGLFYNQSDMSVCDLQVYEASP